MTRIAIINYLNATPFLYGIREYGLDLDPNFNLQYGHPARCAQSLLNGEVDIALVPVAILPQLGEYEIVGNTCIGADGKVGSVLLVSNEPLDKITRVWLDYQSKTSVELCKILMRDLWRKDVEFLDADENYLDQIQLNAAALVIGDRAFDASIQFKYTYDLAEAWKELTSLPFVFALWISKTKIDPSVLDTLNGALAWGILHKEEAISRVEMQYPSHYSIRNYLTHSISYEFDESKQKGLQTFLEMLSN